MRLRTVASLSLVLIACSQTIGECAQHPTPPGLRQADEQTNKPLDPPLVPKAQKPDAARLKQEADELKQLSDEIPSSMSLIAQGQLPKNLTEKLKRIEKLAKALRTQVAQ